MYEIQEALNQLTRADNFKFVNLVSVLHDADQLGLSDSCFSQLVDYIITFVETNK